MKRIINKKQIEPLNLDHLHHCPNGKATGTKQQIERYILSNGDATFMTRGQIRTLKFKKIFGSVYEISLEPLE